MANDTSLRARCFGPDAVDISLLAQHGEAAGARVRAHYGDFLESKLSHIESLVRVGLSGQQHETLLLAAKDMKSSALMAGQTSVATFALLLEQALTAIEPYDPAQARVIAVHVDAIRLAADPQAPLDHLRQVAEHLQGLLKTRSDC